MAKSHRELKKPAQPIPPIPELGNLHKPRKGNRKAAHRIASGVRLWDQRHIDRVKRRRALREQEAKIATDAYFRALEKLTKAVLAGAPSWKGDLELRPVDNDAVNVDELFEAFRSAVAKDDFEPAGGREVLRLLVYGLTHREHIAFRAMLPPTINTAYGHHMRAHTDENQADFQLWDYDPRVSGPLEG